MTELHSNATAVIQEKKAFYVYMALAVAELFLVACALILPPLPGSLFWTFFAWLAALALVAVIGKMTLKIIDRGSER